MARQRYTTIKIPEELAVLLDGHCKDLGYRSRAEAVDDAIRRFIDSRTRLEAKSQKAPNSE